MERVVAVSGDLALLLAYVRSQDHSSSQGSLLGSTVPMHQRFQIVLFLFVHPQDVRFWATHRFSSPSFCWPSFTPELFQPQCTSIILLDENGARVIASSEWSDKGMAVPPSHTHEVKEVDNERLLETS
jgi:hypothetical protein